MKKAAPYLLVGAIFLALVSGSLLTTGMFMDGLIYSNVAANMVEGVGSFWHPIYTATHHPDFYMHPPLALGLLALFYKVLGVHLWVTKAYMVLTMLLCAWLIVRLWRRMGGKHENGWMPLLLWTLIPIVTRFANQCMLENTMVLFDLGAILLLLRPNRKMLNGLLAGLLLAAAFLTKGFVGLFPLVLPLLLWLFDRRKGMLVQTLAMITGFLMPLAVIAMTVPQAREYFANYMHLQVLAGWSQYEVHRWQILVYFLRNIAIVVAIVVIVAIVNKGVGKPVPEHQALWMLVACAVLPIIISTRQHEFYVLTAMPLVAVLSALLIEEPVARWVKLSVLWLIVAVVASVVAVVLNVLNYGKPGRDAELQRDLKVIAPYLERGELVTVPTPLYFDYKLQGYYYRECRVSLGDQERCRHLLTTDEYPADSTYREVPLPTEKYKLYEIKTEKI